MKFDPKIHHRKSIRLKGYDYTSAGAYFITIVTYQRECLFGEIQNGVMTLSAMGQIADENWRAIPEHFPQVILGAFVVMPNHAHGIILLNDGRGTIYRAPTERAPTERAPTERAPTERAPTERAPTERATERAPTTEHAPTERAPTTEQFQKPVTGSIPTIIRTYKASVTRRIQKELNSTNIWQHNYYEHIIRNDAEHNRIHLYIESNPVNWTEGNENPEMKK